MERGKRSIAVNLKTPEGSPIVHRLASSRRRHGETCARASPSVSASATSGSARSNRADLLLGHASARPGPTPTVPASIRSSGAGRLMTLPGFAGRPVPAGPRPTDYYTAALATQGILAALFTRERTGRGQRVETSLLRGVLALQRAWPSTIRASRRSSATTRPTASTRRRRRLVLPRGRQPDVLDEASARRSTWSIWRRSALRLVARGDSRTTSPPALLDAKFKSQRAATGSRCSRSATFRRRRSRPSRSSCSIQPSTTTTWSTSTSIRRSDAYA